MKSPEYLYTSESVTEGHPDKVCDQISDAVLDWCLSQDPTGRVACESAAKSYEGVDWVAVFGEVTPRPPDEQVREIVRGVLRDIGYTRSELGASDRCRIDVHLSGQSADIARGVDDALEHRRGEMTDAEVEAIGAGDQGMMVGFACDETPQLMPLPIFLAQEIARSLSDARKSGHIPYLRPDGKSQVTVAYEGTVPKHVDTVLISAQHREEVDVETLLAPDVRSEVIDPVLREFDLDAEGVRILVNPTGRFEIGGPKADTGVTGRKIIVDSYGGMAPHGGGCFSGKDPTKVDRSAAYMARYVAKNLVAAGAADRLQIQVAYAIGAAHPVSLAVDTFGTESVDPGRLIDVVWEAFDFRPAAIIRDLDLQRPIYEDSAAYGHFGRKEFPWEATDRADELRRAFV
jgi:S-adenosylmethionine synthetase